MAQQQVLLLDDVESLGRSGDIVRVKAGYARNFLLPQSLAVVANEAALRKQKRLQEERAKRAVVDKKSSDELAAKIEGITLTAVVKVDHEGHMYGSVTQADIAELLQAQNIELDKKNIALKHHIKATGIHVIPVKLKEGVTANFNLKVMSEEGHRATEEEVAVQEPKA